MRSTGRPERSNGIAQAVLAAGAAVTIAALVILYAPTAPERTPDPTIPVAPTTTGRTITVDELQALLTAEPGDPPPSVVVETPDGPATVVVPTTTTTSTTTTTAPPTTTPLPPPQDPRDVADRLLGLFDLTPTTTIPEGAGGEP